MMNAARYAVGVQGIAVAERAYQKAVQEGIKEQQRLVAQTEIVQTATLEATRLIDSAHAEADRLRSLHPGTSP